MLDDGEACRHRKHPEGFDAIIGTIKLPETTGQKPWTGVDMDWIGRAGKVLNSAEQMVVVLNLIRWAAYKGYPVEATSEKTGNVDRRAARQALKLLESDGLATIEWRKKQPPLVLDLPECPLIKPRKRATRH